MLESPVAAYVEAREARLRSSAALAAAMGGQVRLYVAVPTDAPLPYVVLADQQALLEDGGCGVTEAELFDTIQWWSRPERPDKGAQARAIGSALLSALTSDVIIDGWDVVDVLVESERYATDPDQSAHGTLVLQFLLSRQVA